MLSAINYLNLERWERKGMLSRTLLSDVFLMMPFTCLHISFHGLASLEEAITKDRHCHQHNLFLVLLGNRLGGAGSRGSFHGRGGLGLERGCGQVRKGGEKVTTGKRKNVTSESHNRKNIATASTFYGDTKVTFEDLDTDLEKYRLDARLVN